MADFDFAFIVGLFLAFIGFAFAKSIYDSDVKKFAERNKNCTLDGIGIVRGVESKIERVETAVDSKTITVYRYNLDIRDISGRWISVQTDWNQWNLGKENSKVKLRYNPSNPSEFAIKNDKLFGGISSVMFGIFMVVGIFGIFVAITLFLMNFR